MVGGARAETNIIITENKTGYANGAEHRDAKYNGTMQQDVVLSVCRNAPFKDRFTVCFYKLIIFPSPRVAYYLFDSRLRTRRIT